MTKNTYQRVGKCPCKTAGVQGASAKETHARTRLASLPRQTFSLHNVREQILRPASTNSVEFPSLT